jgi:hypothetical protein
VLLPKVLERLIVVALHRQSSKKTTKLRELKTNDSGTFTIRNYRPQEYLFAQRNPKSAQRCTPGRKEPCKAKAKSPFSLVKGLWTVTSFVPSLKVPSTCNDIYQPLFFRSYMCMHP